MQHKESIVPAYVKEERSPKRKKEEQFHGCIQKTRVFWELGKKGKGILARIFIATLNPDRIVSVDDNKARE
jgi:hypothetical protein